MLKYRLSNVKKSKFDPVRLQLCRAIEQLRQIKEELLEVASKIDQIEDDAS